MKKFQKNNEGFICFHCGRAVAPHPSSSRDHCNFCLYGMHVDINPGDRMNICKGALVPIGLKITSGKEQIAYRCEKDSQIVLCTIAPDDDKEKIEELSSKVWSN